MHVCPIDRNFVTDYSKPLRLTQSAFLSFQQTILAKAEGFVVFAKTLSCAVIGLDFEDVKGQEEVKVRVCVLLSTLKIGSLWCQRCVLYSANPAEPRVAWSRMIRRSTFRPRLKPRGDSPTS